MSALRAQTQGGARVLIDLGQIDCISEISPKTVGISLRSGAGYRILADFEHIAGILADERGWDEIRVGVSGEDS